MRLLIVCLLIYFGYRLFKKWAISEQFLVRPPEHDTFTAVDDVMVKDPFCETFVPQNKGIRYVVNGTTYYFCSTTCRDKYLEAIKAPKE